MCVCVCVCGGGGTRERSWLRHCTTFRKVAGSIPDGVIGIFHWHNPSGRTMALRTTRPLTETSTRNISWGIKRPVRRADNLTTFMCRLSWNLGASTSWNPQCLSRHAMGLLYLCVCVCVCVCVFINEELNDLYSLPNIDRVIESRRTRWAGHVAHMRDRRGAYRVLVRKLEGKSPLGLTSRRWEVILRWFFKKLNKVLLLNFIFLLSFSSHN